LDTLRRWMRVGWVHALKQSDSHGRWAVRADSEELEHLTRPRACDRGWANQSLHALLIVPKQCEGS
jgi:hypothetical protein